MKPLAASQQMLTWFCVLPVSKSTIWWRQLLYIIFTGAIFIGHCCSIVSSVAYFIKFISTDLEEALYALFQIVSSASMAYVMIVTPFLRHNIRTLFENLHEIYMESKSPIQISLNISINQSKSK